MRYMIMATALILVAGCDGPNEKAGEAQDRAAANAAGIEYKGDGPAERISEAEDRADRAARKDLDAQRDRIKTEADARADRLEEQAREIRRLAKQRADALTSAATGSAAR
ncbi:hypothetical protein [Sphingomonas aerophila]|uniref:DUF4398 domain-containing protein n=1 Tax=Sphingomonas aerophila TaxID=1344948 RepID=A0A7W9BGN5_9SPHN|nr:hypothetical protein [Sphingomonas aerophila]MBB5716847.1 hypothetical protein [Sphingomonas aerophila]